VSIIEDDDYPYVIGHGDHTQHDEFVSTEIGLARHDAHDTRFEWIDGAWSDDPNVGLYLGRDIEGRINYVEIQGINLTDRRYWDA
jgi:hypothetical protein